MMQAAAHGSKTILWCLLMLHNLEEVILQSQMKRIKAAFVANVYRPYLQSVIDHINKRIESTELISSMSVFDPRHLSPKEEELSNYGMEKMKTLVKFYGTVQRVQLNEMEGVLQPDIDPEETESEWNLFRGVIFVKHKGNSLQQVLLQLLGSSDIAAASPNLPNSLQF